MPLCRHRPQSPPLNLRTVRAHILVITLASPVEHSWCSSIAAALLESSAHSREVCSSLLFHCLVYPNAVLELDSIWSLIHMTPTDNETGAPNSRLVMRSMLSARQECWLRVFDSSIGFRLPDSSVLSTDASLVRHGALAGTTPQAAPLFFPLFAPIVWWIREAHRCVPPRTQCTMPKNECLPGQWCLARLAADSNELVVDIWHARFVCVS